MTLYDRFIPGQWVDEINVNDFLNLNKKPFFKEPIFLKKTSSTVYELEKSLSKLLEQVKKEIQPEFSFITLTKKISFPFDSERLMGIQSDNLEKKVGYTENLEKMMKIHGYAEKPIRKEQRKTPVELFHEVSTAEIKKLLKTNVIKSAPIETTPSFVYPDVRMVALYGVKRIVEDKKSYLKTLEKHLQTHEWIQKRISLHAEIEALKKLESYAKLYGVDLSKPAQTSKEAIQFVYYTILACVMENPSVVFSLPNVITFLDIYLENDISNKEISEEEAQEWVDHFYLKCLAIEFVLSEKYEGKETQFFGETLGEVVTKTTYRFLQSFELLPNKKWNVKVIWNKNVPHYFRSTCERLIKKGYPMQIINPRVLRGKENISFVEHGKQVKNGEENTFYAGELDLETIFYLSLNGGKDVKTNTNLLAITQPTYHDHVSYEEVFAKFKEYFSYVVSSYVEMINIILYLNETNQNHNLRTSLGQTIKQSKVLFGFEKIEMVAKLLLSFEHRCFKIERVKKNWIQTVVSTKEFKKDQYEVNVAYLTSFIESELKKIPLYQNGKVMTRIHQRNASYVWGVNELSHIVVLPPEYSESVFGFNLKIEERMDILRLIDTCFYQDFHEINLFLQDNEQMIDGILVKKK